MNTFALQIGFLSLSLVLAVEAAHAGTYHKQVAANPSGEVDLRNVAGSIVISAWDRPAVSVTADLTSDTQRVIVSSGNGRTTVCITDGATTCRGRFSSRRALPAKLQVSVPRESSVDASAVNAGITSRGMAGVQHLTTVNGGIDAQIGSGDNEVTSVNGAIELQGGGHDGALHVTSVNGSLSVKNVAGELEATTVNGKLTAQLSGARIVRLHTVSGGIDLDAHLTRSGTVETQTVSGPLRVDVASPAGYSYAARSFSGDIEDCFGQKADRSQFGPGSHLDGMRGGGAGRVRVQSLSGTIYLCDH